MFIYRILNNKKRFTNSNILWSDGSKKNPKFNQNSTSLHECALRTPICFLFLVKVGGRRALSWLLHRRLFSQKRLIELEIRRQIGDAPPSSLPLRLLSTVRQSACDQRQIRPPVNVPPSFLGFPTGSRDLSFNWKIKVLSNVLCLSFYSFVKGTKPFILKQREFWSMSY